VKTVGPTTMKISTDGGVTWTEFEGRDLSFHAIQSIGPMIVKNIRMPDSSFFLRTGDALTPQEAVDLLFPRSIRERFADARAAIRASPDYISPRRASRRAHRKRMKRGSAQR
jgi:hypothetical protein